MALLTVVLVIIAVGILLWLANKYIPMDGNIKKILNAVVIIVLVLWLLKVFGIFDYLTKITI